MLLTVEHAQNAVLGITVSVSAERWRLMFLSPLVFLGTLPGTPGLRVLLARAL